MKKQLIALCTACVLAVVMIGCKGEAKVETAKFEQAFAGSSGEIKEAADKVAADVKANNLAAALDSINKIMTKSNELSQAQLDAAGEVFVMLNVASFERGAKQSATEAKSKADELQKQATGAN
ncbi:MAG TPA: hypothetical protein DCY13_24720 [Verrucomicrobiales bacterium]|nr:hypothetical protein [Verrucomicrobiales bacterium]